MSTDTKLLSKGLKYITFLILLFIAAPIMLTMGFKALKKFKDTPQEYISYLLISLAALLIIFSIFFAFKTFKILLNAIFNK